MVWFHCTDKSMFETNESLNTKKYDIKPNTEAQVNFLEDLSSLGLRKVRQTLQFSETLVTNKKLAV